MNFTFSNPEEAYSVLKEYVRTCGVVKDSRNGLVKMIPNPVLVTFLRPNDRVLTDVNRRANPFFHLAEALWMLSGRNDTDYVLRFNSNIGAYSDDGMSFNAAYGHRWVNHFGYNQIIVAIDMLTRNPDDRRVVVSMWDPYRDLASTSKDVPCNTQLMFSVHDGALSMTSVNRSNDLIWGLMGANCVHLSILHEFMALATGYRLGAWHHMTNNLHVYEHHWQLHTGSAAQKVDQPMPLFEYCGQWETFLGEVGQFCNGRWDNISLPFLRHVAIPMENTWELCKAKHYEKALDAARAIACPHWRTAANLWIDGAKTR